MQRATRGDALKLRRLLPFLATFLTITAAAQTVPVVMLSDIHLDPFHDPAKVAQLLTAPTTGWSAILNTPASPTQAADFAKLQSTCGAKGVDSPIALLESSLAAAHTQQPHPLFVTVSGDLMAHRFDCRFHTLAPSATDADYSAFAAKTVAFVALRLRQTFPHTPVYLALGNNDSGCKDYREDPNSAFLQADAQSFAADAVSAANSRAIRTEFSQYGDYNIALPAPFTHTRLIVLQDIFESARYTNCSGSSGDSSTNAASSSGSLQVDWLRTQLTAARAAHERVWVMAHIPPGIDAYSTIKKGLSSCGAGAPEFFIPSDSLASTISQFADTIKLALFGHTHMDEMRVYASTDPGTKDAVAPGKLVPSITPVNGNNPAFTIAAVDSSTATLKDYTVYSASTQTSGADSWDSKATKWSEEYNYAKTYGLPDFSGTSAAKLSSTFLADKSGSADASLAYQRFYYVGDPNIAANVKAAAMKLVWHAYACSIAHTVAASYSSCLCAATPSTPAQ